MLRLAPVPEGLVGPPALETVIVRLERAMLGGQQVNVALKFLQRNKVRDGTTGACTDKHGAHNPL